MILQSVGQGRMWHHRRLPHPWDVPILGLGFTWVAPLAYYWLKGYATPHVYAKKSICVYIYMYIHIFVTPPPPTHPPHDRPTPLKLSGWGSMYVCIYIYLRVATCCLQGLMCFPGSAVHPPNPRCDHPIFGRGCHFEPMG